MTVIAQQSSASSQFGWKAVELGQIAELRGRIGWKGLTAKEYTTEGPRFLSVHSLNYGDYVDFRDGFHISQERYDESPEIMLQRDDILICKDGAGIGKLGVVPEIKEPTTINSSMLLVRPGQQVLAKYLYFCLLSPYFQKIVQSRLEGATTPHLYQRDIKEFPVQLAPLEEQKRIVAVLDQAFAALDRARANAEANLADAEELLTGARRNLLRSSEAGSAWTDKPLGEVCVLQRGFDLPKPQRKAGKYPLVTSSGVTDSHSETKVKGPGVATGRSGSIGNVFYVEDDFWPLNTALYIKEFHGNEPKFVYHMLKDFDLSRFSSGAGVPTLNRNDVHGELVCVPDSVQEQRMISANLDEIAARQIRLKAQFAAKLDDISDLRQSILQKAFAGELT